MPELILPEQQRGRVGVRMMKKANLKVDMTPMVDLGFLLIAFFIFTTEISRPTVTNLYMPKDKDSTTVEESGAMTILLGAGNNVYYYFGLPGEAFKNNRIISTTYSVYEGIGQVIREKQKAMSHMAGNKKLMVLIKPGNETPYKRVVDVLDEMLINNVKRYAIVDLEVPDKSFLNTHRAQ